MASQSERIHTTPETAFQKLDGGSDRVFLRISGKSEVSLQKLFGKHGYQVAVTDVTDQAEKEIEVSPEQRVYEVSAQ